jgi:hypothetical protein
MAHTKEIIGAKEYLVFGYGFDALGDNHFVKGFKPTTKKPVDPTELPERRLFNNNDYGYYKTKDISKLEAIYPKSNTAIPFDNFKDYLKNKSKAISAQKLFNNERLGVEAIKYRELIKEKRSKTADYFKNKAYVNGDEIAMIEELRKRISL